MGPLFHLFHVENLDPSFSQARPCPRVPLLSPLPLHLTTVDCWMAGARDLAW